MWFGFDPLGRCVKRWVSPLVGTSPNQQAPPVNTNPATYYYYDGWNLVQEGSTGNVADRVYVHGGRVDEIVASQVGGGEWRHHHYDARGHCIMLTDPSGAIREQYDYDAFGYPYFLTGTGSKLTTSPWGNRFLFTGREWLKELKIYDYRNRIYQPELGRFLQPDPKQFEAGDYNLYRYCHNDPVNKVDPTGLDFTDPGLGQFVERIPGFFGTTSITLKVAPVDQGNGTFKLRLDVKVTDRRVAERGANDVKRTKEAMDATCEHEEVEHSKDWRGFHDENQSQVPNTVYPNIEAAREAAKPIEDKVWDAAEKAKDKFEEHKPDSRWKDILDRESKT